jgi:aminocarboxymuconate-semialdehyde decarboxylase
MMNQLNAIDVHTHVYPARYMAMLRRRNAVPRVVRRGAGERLVILPGEDADPSTSAGRPIGGEFHEVGRKLAFMDAHGIAVSVLSLANPWLDFLEPAEAAPLARDINDELQEWCEGSNGRLFAFGALPIRDPKIAAAELRRIARLSKLRGSILGTSGAGRGLDDPALDPVWREAEANEQMIFIHPHYGLGHDAFAGTGHVLPLAMGFPFETSAAVARLILAGALDRFPRLKLLIAHGGGTLPYLAGRLDSCLKTDHATKFPAKEPPSAYLKRLYYDAILYHRPALDCLIGLVGIDRIMFGTDHPFFAPDLPAPRLDQGPWPVPAVNIPMVASLDKAAAAAVFQGNARRILDLG